MSEIKAASEYNPGDVVEKPDSNVRAIRVDDSKVIAGDWFIFDPAAGGAGYVPHEEIEKWAPAPTAEPEPETPSRKSRSASTS